MNGKATLTTDEVLQETGIRSIQTLIRWHRAGVIPPPDRVQHPGGRGKTGRWPGWVVRRVRRVQDLQKEGFTLEQIARRLGQDWEAEARMWRSETAPAGEADVLVVVGRQLGEMISAKADSLLGVESGWGESRAALAMRVIFTDWKVVTHALDLLDAGCQPLALFDGQSVMVWPDFRVGVWFADSPPARGKACVAVSLLPELEDLCRRHNVQPGPQRPRQRLLPAPKVWAVPEGGEPQELEFSPGGPLGFQIVPRSTEPAERADKPQGEGGRRGA